MGEEDDPAGSRAAERLLVFSDAVVAIAITLLALDLPLPEGSAHNAGQFWKSLKMDSGAYLAFVVSFVVVAVMWSRHHELLGYTAKSDRRMRGLNLAWLMAVILIPFAARLLTSSNSDSVAVHAFRWGFYALVTTVGNVLFLAMVDHLIRYRLQSDDAPPDLLSKARRQTLPTAVAFGISIPIFFVTKYGWVAWAVTPAILHWGWVWLHRGAKSNWTDSLPSVRVDPPTDRPEAGLDNSPDL